jgi:hypothetical protein
MNKSGNKRNHRGALLLILTAAVLTPTALLVRNSNTISRPNAKAAFSIVGAAGKPLTTFFDGIPASSHVKEYAEIDARRQSKPEGISLVALRVQHFFGLAMTVHADGGCSGCNVSKTDAYDCGCGQRYDILTGDTTGSGQGSDSPVCAACSTLNQSAVCAGNCGS